MQIMVLTEELERCGGTVPDGDALQARALEEKAKMEELQDQAEQAELDARIREEAERAREEEAAKLAAIQADE